MPRSVSCFGSTRGRVSGLDAPCRAIGELYSASKSISEVVEVPTSKSKSASTGKLRSKSEGKENENEEEKEDEEGLGLGLDFGRQVLFGWGERSSPRERCGYRCGVLLMLILSVGTRIGAFGPGLVFE